MVVDLLRKAQREEAEVTATLYSRMSGRTQWRSRGEKAYLVQRGESLAAQIRRLLPLVESSREEARVRSRKEREKRSCEERRRNAEWFASLP